MKIIESYIVSVPTTEDRIESVYRQLVLTDWGNWYMSADNGTYELVMDWRAKELANIED